MAKTADPEAVALIEGIAAVLDPTDAAIFRRTVLDRAAPDVIAAEVGPTAADVRARWEILHGRVMAALSEAAP